VFDEKGPKIEECPCPSLANAIIFAETLFVSQLRATIPSLDKALDPKFSVLSLGKHYFLLSVTKRIPLAAAISRKVVRGMIDGLRYLHGQGIIHRDVRLSNLILKRERNGVNVNVVIIDYETAFDSGGRNHSTSNGVDYSGGYICWPRRLLQSREQSYMPEPADDLFETSRVLQMWRDIENSKIWGQFYQAARDQDYDGLLEISEVFCHI
jgi:serine/threonine protein kinase